MKKYLLLCLSTCIALASIAAPWDFNTGPRCYTRAYTDPYVTNYSGYNITISGTNYLQLQVSFDQEVPAPYYVVIQVLGKWEPNTSGTSYREFTILFNTGQWHKTVNYPLGLLEEAYPSLMDLLDYGPQ